VRCIAVIIAGWSTPFDKAQLTYLISFKFLMQVQLLRILKLELDSFYLDVIDQPVTKFF
jgi:hypothetical protein